MLPAEMSAVLQLMPEVRETLATLASHPMSEVLVRVLQLMQSAVISRDQSFSLLRYWSALEQLYSEPNSRDKNYPRIIQRASFAELDKSTAPMEVGAYF
jgi:hypothetical protein